MTDQELIELLKSLSQPIAPPAPVYYGPNP